MLILFGIIKSTMAYPTLRDSTAAYQYGAHRGIIEMVYAYMNDYIDSAEASKSIERELSKKEYERVFIKGIDKDTLPDLVNVSAFLKTNDWVETEKNILQPLIANYKKSLALNVEFFDLKRSESNNSTISKIKTINWDKKLLEIIGNYEKDLSSFAEAPKTSIENTFQFNEPSKVLITTKMMIIYFLLVLLGVLIGASFVYSFSKRKIYSILREERVYYLDYPPLKSEKSIFHYITLFHVLKRRKDSYKKHNMELKTELESLELENSELKHKL